MELFVEVLRQELICMWSYWVKSALNPRRVQSSHVFCPHPMMMTNVSDRWLLFSFSASVFFLPAQKIIIFAVAAAAVGKRQNPNFLPPSSFRRRLYISRRCSDDPSLTPWVEDGKWVFQVGSVGSVPWGHWKLSETK